MELSLRNVAMILAPIYIAAVVYVAFTSVRPESKKSDKEP